MRELLAIAAVLATVAAGCGPNPFEIRDYPLDLAPTDTEFVKFDPIGEGTLPRGARILLGTVVTDGPVDAETVRNTIAMRGQRIGHCYAGALNDDPRAGGDVVLGARIGRDGLTREVLPIYDAVHDPGMLRCIANGLEGLYFMEAERQPPTDVRLPLRFQPGVVPPVVVPPPPNPAASEP